LALGARLGRLLSGGEVIELVSDLGGGKTLFVRGLAQGLGYTGTVTSPTFTISRVYHLPLGKELHHFDFYRLPAGDIVAHELAEVVGDPDVITAVEWAGTVQGVLPAARLRVLLSGEDERRAISVESIGPAYDQVIKALQQ
jgi:tRNA threonylcarbamoyladenosine biosynthesis protein TsaE